MKPTSDQIEEKRLRRILAIDGLTPFEREDAERQLAKLQERRDPTCAHCEQRTSAHGATVCPVVALFRRPFGKLGRDLLPTATQAAEVRRRIRETEEAKRATEARRAAKAGQGSLF